jgi:hypothetical protein
MAPLQIGYTSLRTKRRHKRWRCAAHARISRKKILTREIDPAGFQATTMGSWKVGAACPGPPLWRGGARAGPLRMACAGAGIAARTARLRWNAA